MTERGITTAFRTEIFPIGSVRFGVSRIASTYASGFITKYIYASGGVRFFVRKIIFKMNEKKKKIKILQESNLIY